MAAEFFHINMFGHEFHHGFHAFGVVGGDGLVLVSQCVGGGERVVFGEQYRHVLAQRGADNALYGRRRRGAAGEQQAGHRHAAEDFQRSSHQDVFTVAGGNHQCAGSDAVVHVGSVLCGHHDFFGAVAQILLAGNHLGVQVARNVGHAAQRLFWRERQHAHAGGVAAHFGSHFGSEGFAVVAVVAVDDEAGHIGMAVGVFLRG